MTQQSVVEQRSSGGGDHLEVEKPLGIIDEDNSVDERSSYHAGSLKSSDRKGMTNSNKEDARRDRRARRGSASSDNRRFKTKDSPLKR